MTAPEHSHEGRPPVHDADVPHETESRHELLERNRTDQDGTEVDGGNDPATDTDPTDTDPADTDPASSDDRAPEQG
ncbi:MAG: hypothetical protein ACR2F6_15510 [Mycobacteriales bacterium]